MFSLQLLLWKSCKEEKMTIAALGKKTLTDLFDIAYE